MNLPTRIGNTSRTVIRVAFGIAICAGLALGGPVAAQDDPPVEDVLAEVVATEAPPPPPTEPPPPPTEVPPPPPPTDPPPPPTDVPVEPTDPPTDVPATEIPTSELTATSAPTEPPTPSPTATPEPELTYALAEQPDCALAPDQPAAIASGGSLDYTCTDQLTLNGTQIAPAHVTVSWSAQVTVGGGWTVQMLPPVNDPDQAVAWTAAGQSGASFTFEQRTPAGTSVVPGTLDTSTGIAYRLRVQRVACAIDPQTIELRHSVVVQSPDANARPHVATFVFADPEPLRLTPGLAPIPEPDVAFGGALNFGDVGVTAQGPSESVQTGTLPVVVANLDRTCGGWTLHVAASALTGGDGAPLDGAQLVVTSIDGVALPDGGCDLANGCDLATLTGDPGSVSTMTVTLGVALRMPEQPNLGVFETTLTAALHPVAADS